MVAGTGINFTKKDALSLPLIAINYFNTEQPTDMMQSGLKSPVQNLV
jgi:hypothetical protein